MNGRTDSAGKRIPRGLYAITNGPRDDLVAACAAALAGGASVLQYRDKTADIARRHEEAKALAHLCRRHAVPLIINDDVELAIRSGAAGVHLGRDDMPLRQARAQLGAAALIGVSCYNDLERARDAAAGGADYLAFGSFYSSVSKPDAVRADPALLRAAKALQLPLVAIGGITPENAPALIAAGADFVAVISALADADDIAATARRFARAFRSV